MKISSPSFRHEGMIPPEYTCEGANLSPALVFEDVPPEAKVLALIMEDPDAPSATWVHWLVYNIPADGKGLPAHVPPVARLPDRARQGKNSFRKIGYGGPCPPPGHGAHRYFFRLYALDKALDLNPGISRSELDTAMKGHVLSRAEIMARYERQNR